MHAIRHLALILACALPNALVAADKTPKPTPLLLVEDFEGTAPGQIGRASCRERVCYAV